MAIAAGAVLGLACLFLLYVLVQFHREATRPRPNSPQSSNRVITFRRKLVSQALADHKERKGTPGKTCVSQVTVPVEFKRLAAKRMARS